ncbi:hypothetical protein B5F08_06415 [Anaeromassilibacillus sp. An172]|uniref:anti-sigma factor antagonist n=1 Tax=Anaeromassilibacillus sp. An172 TaxID=1965570 RepID=UPI000B37B45F|nr:anti-sigma factor antagonist [Anaeromassilibacillus sp. An172]OUP78706.1 hypothetical protein B5F08_06415 [Anaeromassilibacillus sp. An172]
MEITYENDVMTAYLKGEIDHHSAAPIRSEIDGKSESLRPKILRLDFSGVKFMDSSGIGLIMGRYRQISLLGGSLEVVNIPKSLDRIISLSGVCSLGVVK